MDKRCILGIGLALTALLILSCSTQSRAPRSLQEPQGILNPQGQPYQNPPRASPDTSTPLTANVPLDPQAADPPSTLPPSSPADLIGPSGAAATPLETILPGSGSTIIKLIPAGPFTDDDLIKSMTLLKIELATRPELRVKDIIRQGDGKDSYLAVETGLSSGKPVISVINALANRERFEGRVGDKVVFTNNDMLFVCKLAACAAVEDMSVCPSTPTGVTCSYGFGTVITDEAAARLTETIKGKPTKTDNGDTVIAEPVNLYLNDNLLDYVYIPADLADKPVTDFTISGNATGTDAKDAQKKAVAAMDRVRNQIARKILPIQFNIES